MTLIGRSRTRGVETLSLDAPERRNALSAALVGDLAAALTDAVSDPARAAAYGVAGRRRAEESFSWDAIAGRTLQLYRSLT